MFNEASKRKSPNAVAFDDTERQFGDTAMVKAHKAMTHTRELLGKGFKAEILKNYGPYYFPYEIVEDEERGAIKIKESDRYLSPEVLVAMILTYAKSLAQAQTKEKVSDCVITVPSFFRQFERQVTTPPHTPAAKAGPCRSFSWSLPLGPPRLLPLVGGRATFLRLPLAAGSLLDAPRLSQTSQTPCNIDVG